MRKQQQIWLEEHTKQTTLPSMANVTPTGAVEMFTDSLAAHDVPLNGKAVYIGSGKGRNSVHLAKIGFDVWGLEYIQPAIDVSKKLAESNGVADKITFTLTEIDKPWNFEDNFFDIAVDSYSSIDIETKEGRETYRDEMLRTLKPGGYALVCTCSAEDEWEKDLIAANPGPEPNSTYWPSGKFQKDYTEDELREFYKDFEVIELAEIEKPAFKLGRQGMATDFRVILRKPQ